MSTVRTSFAPSYASGGGGGGLNKRGRGDGDDGRDRRRPDKPKPLDKISMADFGPDGKVRQLIMLLLQVARLGELPSGGLLTAGKQPRLLETRTGVVKGWAEGLMNAPQGLANARFTELAQAFVHVLRAVNTAGLFDQLVAMLTELLTNRALERADEED